MLIKSWRVHNQSIITSQKFINYAGAASILRPQGHHVPQYLRNKAIVNSCKVGGVCYQMELAMNLFFLKSIGVFLFFVEGNWNIF